MLLATGEQLALGGLEVLLELGDLAAQRLVGVVVKTFDSLMLASELLLCRRYSSISRSKRRMSLTGTSSI